jgi:hypothetical protein
MHGMPYKDVMKPIGFDGLLVTGNVLRCKAADRRFRMQMRIWTVVPLGRNA